MSPGVHAYERLSAFVFVSYLAVCVLVLAACSFCCASGHVFRNPNNTEYIMNYASKSVTITYNMLHTPMIVYTILHTSLVHMCMYIRTYMQKCVSTNTDTQVYRNT